MKKLLIFMILIMPLSYAREEAPIMPSDKGVYINSSDSNLDLINTDKMKRKESVNKAKRELKEKSQNSIQIDLKTLEQQRALDYMTKPDSSFAPPIF